MVADKVNSLVIKTPEGVVFSMPLAGPVVRFVAFGVDLAVVTAVSQTLAGLFNVLTPVSADLAGAASILLYFIISIGYGIYMEWRWRGQTLGKRLLRLRVMDENGLRLTFSQVVIRNLMRFVDALPAFYMVGGLACLISRQAQRLGDYAAGTVVVRNPEVGQPNLEQIMSDKYNSFHDYPHLEARLRQRVSPGEAGIALRALLRRETLEPDARVALFRAIAGHFRSVIDFPSEVTEGMSDEKYVRNIVDVLYGKGRPK